MLLTVTDVTAFKNSTRCVAGIDPQGNCWRPTRAYFSDEDCKTLRILPGTKIEGDFTRIEGAARPHVEDCSRKNVKFSAFTSAQDFFDLLSKTVSVDVQSGFDITFGDYNKCIPESTPPKVSIITIDVQAGECKFVYDEYKRKAKMSFTDASGVAFSYLPFADFAINNFISMESVEDDFSGMNSVLNKQEHIFLRIGLGRCHEMNGKRGFWLQVNGLYTFPRWFPGTRGFTEEASVG